MFSQRMCNNFLFDYLLLLLKYTLLYFIYILAWGIKNITYGILHFLYLYLWKKKLWTLLIGVELLGIFILILISLNISLKLNSRSSVVSFEKGNAIDFFFAHRSTESKLLMQAYLALWASWYPVFVYGCNKNSVKE